MAKLKAPLMSIDARGKLADTLVFSGWKGLKVARSYAVPANPNTAAQQTQRSYMSNTVLGWRDLESSEIENWNRYNQFQAKAQSGFNAFTSNLLQAQSALAEALYATSFSYDDGASMVETDLATIDDQTAVSGGETVELHYGTSPNVLANTVSMNYVTGATHSYDASGLSAGVTWYGRVYSPSESRYVSGLLKFET